MGDGLVVTVITFWYSEGGVFNRESNDRLEKRIDL